ncbi:unnamed protein product [Cunninghamella blakesleeana]
MTYYKYVVTAQKATATHFSVKGSFTSSHDINLILGKGNRIEIYTLTPDGLKPTLEFSIFGTIVALQLYKPKGRSQASLFLLIAHHKYCILTYSAESKQIFTEDSNEIGLATLPSHSNSLASSFTPIQISIEPTYHYIATLLYPSIITIVIPSSGTANAHNNITIDHTSRRSSRGSGKKRQAISVPKNYAHLCFPDKKIISATFLSSINMPFTSIQENMNPTLAVLYDDQLDRRYLQLYKYNEITKSAIPGDIILDHIEDDANLLITVPLPIGGVLLVSGQYIRYLKPNHPPKAIGILSSSIINCYSVVNNEGSRYLLGSTDGSLYLLVLNVDHSQQIVSSLGFMELGPISIPSCLTYLENEVLYVGSSKGDSQLIHILQRSSIENNDNLQVIENYPSLGPITDFCVVDLDKQGQPQLITCSGASKNSSLRIIRSGVGLNQLATIEISGVKDTWTLRESFLDKFSNILMMTFVNETRLIQLKDNDIIPLLQYSAFNLNQRTIAAGNMIDDVMIQITERSIRLMTCGIDGILLDEWFPPPSTSSNITLASINPTQCVVSIGFGHLIAFTIQDRKLTIVGQVQLEQEISCIDIAPIDSPVTKPYSSSVIAVGLWRQVGVRLIRFDSSLACIASEDLPGMVTPRSIIMTRLEDICYLIIALGDGQVYNFKFDSHQGRLWDKKRSFLGKLPIILSNFISNGITHVFAASDKPSVIHSRNQKLVYSNVNLKDVRCATSFNSPYFPDAVALTTPDGVIIGQMEEIQKLHITKIPTLDTPRRIVYQETTHTFGVITEKMTSEPFTSQSTTGGFELLDDQNFSLMDRIYFKQYERPLAAASITYDQDEYYVIGTGRDSDAFESTSSGRILVLKVTTQHSTSSSTLSIENKQKLTLISQTRTQGMVEQIRAFKDKVIACIHGKLVIYEWKLQNNIPQLVIICSHHLSSITESIAIHGDNILVGDMLASVTALKYDNNKQPPVIEEIGADEVVREVTALEALSDTLAIGAERDGHLFVIERIVNSANDLSSNANLSIEDPLLETVSEWNLGDVIQKFQFGSLGNIDPDLKSSTPTSSALLSSSLLFVTVNGAIGIVADLTEERYRLLWHMQNNMTKVIKSIGGFNHTDWRNIAVTLERKEERSYFIDGDLIESFLDLTPQQMQQVIEGHNNGKKLDYSIEDLCKVVEELMSLHS